MSTTIDKPRLSRAHALDLLRQMLRIRRFEEKCAELYTQEKIRGFLHLYDGEEAVAGGVIPVREPRDREAEVVDLRSLRPLDDATITASVRKTRRAVVIDEGWRSGSLAAEICTRLVEQAFFDLDAPLARVCSEEVPIPYPRHLEQAAIPQAAKIVAAAKRALGREG